MRGGWRIGTLTWWLCATGIPGCGYVGVDDGLELDKSDGEVFATGASSWGGKAPGAATGGASSSGGDSGASGGSDGVGGGEPTGGAAASGGDSATGGATVLPAIPCSTDCAEPFYLYRSFEIGTPVSPTVSGGGSVERDDSTVWRGDYSMRFEQGAPGSESELAEPIRTINDSAFYFRAWAYVAAGSLSDWFKIVAFNGTDTPGIDINVLADGRLQVFSNPSQQVMTSEKSVVPVGGWFCLQAAVKVHELGGISVSVDEQNVVTLTDIDTSPGDGVNTIVYGIAATGMLQDGAKVYFDEVVVSSEPVPCK